MRTLIIDNHDSFTFNLYQLVGMLDAPPRVLVNDAVTIDEVVDDEPERIIFSPGPGHPRDAWRVGVCTEIIRRLGDRVPILGVCLGHQNIVHELGGRVVRAARPMHGRTSLIRHRGSALFENVPEQFEAMRYHSLVAERSSLPASLRVTAESDDGVVMAVQHVTWPLFGIQFHPESIGTSIGRTVLENFLHPSSIAYSASHPRP